MDGAGIASTCASRLARRKTMSLRVRIGRLLAAVALTGASALSSADAALIRFGADLGPEAAGATGSGSVLVEFDDVEHTLQIFADWSGLGGTTTIAHIHCCVAPPGTVGVAVTPGTLPGFPVGTTSGSYVSPPIDLDLAASFTSTFLTGFGGGTAAGATGALLAGMDGGTAYFNIHTVAFPAGEIRGFLHRVPEPAMLALLGAALAAMLIARCRGGALHALRAGARPSRRAARSARSPGIPPAV
jgi:hypothetical protein